MTSTEFLAELEPLSFPARQSRVCELGRDPRNAGLWDELERGATSYERRLALQGCSTSRDGERVLRMLADSSRLVRSLAIRLLCVVCDDAQIERAFPGLRPNTARNLLKRLKKRRRQSTIDAVLKARFSANSDEGALESLVPFASPEVAFQLLGAQFERASVEDFARLARLQPRLSLQKALELARALTSPDGVVLAKANAVLQSAASFRDAAQRQLSLDLVRELNRHFPLARLELNQILLHGQAQALAELVLESGETVQLPWSSRVTQIEASTLISLIRAQNGAIGDWARVLKRLPFGTRAQLYGEFNLGWRDARGVISVPIVALLPRELRHLEARRHLDIPDLKAAPGTWLPFLAFLPFAEALEAARPFLGDPDPDFRAAALAALVGNTRFERQRIGEILELLQKRGNEQDPVRMAMLGALAALPPSIFGEDQLPFLATIQRQALDARDLSFGTAAALERLVVAQLPRFPSWAATQIAQLLKERGQVSFFDLQSRINDRQMREIGPVLEPVFAGWAAREHAPFLGAMRALGKRLKVWDAGAQLLVEFVRSGPANQQLAGAQILAKFRGDLWRELVPQLLQRDESWGTQAVVYLFLHRKRQDLLSPTLLGRAVPKGRFWTGKTRFVLPLRDGFGRWTPAQQTTFALILEQVISDTARDNYGVFSSINALAELPDNEPARLLELAGLATKKPAVREAALRVLSRLDGGQGVATLLDALDDERARIAIYGLRRALIEMPTPRALEILRNVPLQKVTVAKEVARLLGDLPLPAAFDFLLEVAGRDLHRDVRVALLRSLWDHLEDPRVWPILENAARSEDPAIATMAARTTAPRMSASTRRKLNALLATLLAHPDARVRLQVLGNGAVGAISDPENQLLEPLLRCLDSKVAMEYSAATRAFWQTYASTRPAALGKVIERLLPRRRALGEIAGILEWQLAASSRHFEEATRAVLQSLQRDPLAISLRLRLCLRALPVEEFAVEVETLVASNALHEGALAALVADLETFGRNSRHLAPLLVRWTPASSPLLRRLALAVLVGQARDSVGWVEARRELLRFYRADQSPLVASAAQFTFWPGEEE